ncbi:MAG TPA: TonB-dependent receptor [Thermoanaerobaculia bacterium]|nr:TonB-dependent receptor [Thermoanaerobaculia bacterium]
MRFLHRFFVLMAVLLVAASAFAQTTSSLTGTVTLEGNPVPGVTVTISSPAMLGTRSTQTDVNGNYNFGGIPPGEYTVKFELESMQTVTRQVRIGVSQTGRADAAMKLSAVAESITVTASAPAVLETVEIQANVPQKLVDDLPIGRRVQDAVLLTPGVNNNGPNAGTSITISGAPAYDSVFMVNGAVINENLRGQAHNLFIEDAVQETTVLTGAISAEYGRFTGGVVNAITKSGGNEFHGSLRDSLTNDKWTAINSKYYDVVGGTAPDRLDKSNPVYEGTFGGRIIRDRLWFFLAGRYAKLSSQRSFTASPNGNPNPPTFVFADENKRYEAKLTGQITPNHTLVASYLDIKNPQTNNCFIACYEPLNLDTQRSLPNNFYSFHYNGILTNSFLLEANYSKKKFTFEGSGGDFKDDLSNGTAYYDLQTGYFFGAPVFCGVCDPESRDNDLWTAKATYYLASKGFGTHNLVGGVENWKETRLSNNYQSASNWFINVNNSPDCDNFGSTFECRPFITAGDIIQHSPIFALSKGSDFQTRSVFANDKWDFNQHWSFNLGVRYDKNNGKDSSGAEVAKDSAFSPRLGLIYDITGNGRYRVNASYSKYVSKIAETIGGAGTNAGAPATIYYEYQGPDINGGASPTLNSAQAAGAAFAWFNALTPAQKNELIVFARVPGLNQKIGDDLKSPSVNEYTVGFGTQLTTNSFVRVDLLHRDWQDFYAVFRNRSFGIVNDQFGNRFDLGFVENSNDFERKYNAVTAQASYRPWERLNIGGNYTWSKLEGNVTAETSGSGPVSEARFSYPEFRAFAQNNPTGLLNPDQRHKLRAWVSYDLPTPIGRWNFSVLERFDSGTHFSAIGTVDTRFNATLCPTCPANANLGYATPPSNVPYYFSDRGAFTWDDVTSTDLGINYELPISRLSLFVQADIINIFNEQAQVGGDQTVFTHRTAGAGLRRFDPFTTAPIECPQGNTPAQCQALGANFQLASTFGQPLAATGGSNTNGSYQLPRTYRFSFGLRF